MFIDRKFIIFNVSEINKINFQQVLETSSNTLKKSYDETLTFVKWDGATPSCVNALTTGDGPYTYSEILSILSTETWTGPTMSNP